MSQARPDHLEPWTVWVCDTLVARGTPAALTYVDKLAGDVLLLALASGDRDRLVEVTVTRRPKGHAHLTALATTLAGATAALDAVARLHAEVARLANAKRKFVHRIERLLANLVRSWGLRTSEPARGRDLALTRLRAAMPEAVALVGVGFHVDVAGADDHHSREVYPSVFGAAVLIDGGWRGLAWDPGGPGWRIHAATAAALRRAHPAVDLGACGITLVEAAALGAAAAAAVLAGAIALDAEVPGRPRAQPSGGCAWGDALDPCELLSCSLDIGDLGNCVPDCGSLDLGGLDCGGLDCSL